jgi:hypothetical protein
MRSRICTSALIVFLVYSGLAHAQSVRVNEIAGCSGCAVRMTKVTTLLPGVAPETGLPAHPYNLARDSKGRFIATFMETSPPRIFAPDGRFVRSLGRLGKGPGEFERAYGVWQLPGDTIMVLDTRGRNFYGGDFTRIRTDPPPPLYSFETTLPNGTRVVWETYDPKTSAIQLNHQTSSGKHLRRLSIPYPMRPTVTIPTLRLAAAGRNSFWWLMSNEYHIERWSTDGAKKLTIDRKADWWVDPVGERVSPTKAQAPIRVSAKHPMSSLNDLRDDGKGHLWVIGRVPRKDLPPDDTLRRTGEGPFSHPYDRYDTIVEVFDSNTGKLLVTQRFSGYFSHLLGNGYLAKLVDDEEGRPVVEIWKAELAGVK